MMKKLCILFCFLFSISANAKLTAELSPKAITEGQSVDLILSSDEPLAGSPDFSPLTADFSLGAQGQIQRMAIRNGKRTSLYQYSVSLSPLKTGTIEIPSITWDTESSEPLTLVITEAGSALTETEGNLFLKATVSSEKVYPKQQIIYTASVYDRVGLVDGEFIPPSAPDTEVGKLGEPRLYTKEIEGKMYQVYEQKFIVISDKTGPLNLTPAVFKGYVYTNESPSRRSSFFGMHEEFLFGTPRNQKEVILKAENITVDILDKPETAKGKPWFPSTEVYTEQKWTPEENTLKQGDTLTRTVKIQARGVLPNTIPDLTMKDGVGYKVYPSEPKTSLGYDSSGLISIWERDFVIIPTESGEVQILDLSFSWFDTTKNEQTMTFIPGKILNVEENPIFSKENPVPQTEVPEKEKTPPQTDAVSETLCTPVGEKNFFERENNFLFFISGLFFGWITVLLSIFIVYLIKRRKKKLPDLYPY